MDTDAIQEVETFIKRCRDFDYTVSPQANNLRFYKKTDNPNGFNFTKTRTLSDSLSKAINDYLTHKNDGVKTKIQYAKIARLWINKAFNCGVVLPSDGLVRKLDECDAEKAHLEEELDILSAKYLKVKREYAEFKKRVGLKSKAEWESKEK